ncbi:sugar ABC transporter permease [Streptomyces sp. NPDC093085]|uniref:carbohydrate ABC transporter permease n=1 Tax=Streptomyces sp. NPDC093085 TaxID=3155068 RepID=UPI00341A14F0
MATTTGSPRLRQAPRGRQFPRDRAARRRSAVPAVLLTPALAFLAVFVFVPALLTPVLALFNIDLIGRTASFTGLQNLRAEVSNGELLTGVRNTVLYTVLTVPPALAVGLLSALGIRRIRRGKSFWRTVYFLPTAATLVAMAVAWKWIFAPDGLFDHTVGALTGTSDWLNDYSLALPALAVVGVWQQSGFNTVLFLAGLTAVPNDAIEAATLDGANAWQRFRHIIWPAIGPSTTFAVITSTTTALRAFDQIQVLTGGGPGDATKTLTFLLWSRGVSYLDVGGAAVLAVALLLLVALITVWQVRSFRQLEKEGAR